MPLWPLKSPIKVYDSGSQSQPPVIVTSAAGVVPRRGHCTVLLPIVSLPSPQGLCARGNSTDEKTQSKPIKCSYLELQEELETENRESQVLVPAQPPASVCLWSQQLMASPAHLGNQQVGGVGLKGQLGRSMIERHGDVQTDGQLNLGDPGCPAWG